MRSLPSYPKVVRAFRKKGVALSVKDSHEQHLIQVTKQSATIANDFRGHLSVYLSWHFGGRKIDITGHTHDMLVKIRSTPRPKNS